MTNLIIKTIVDTLYLTGMIITIGFILGILRENSMRNFQKSFGWNAVVITSIIGVPIHELSHAILCLIFRHKISKMVLLQKRDEDGTLGYVNHSYNTASIYQQMGNFFIGVAPIFGGISVIIALMYYFIPNSYNDFIAISLNNLQVQTIDGNTIKGILESYWELIKIIFSIQNFTNPYFLLFLFLSICISTHISLSSADIKGASKGLIMIFIIVFFSNILGPSNIYIAKIILRYNLILTGFLIIAVIFSTITYLISLVSTLIKTRI